MTREITHMKAFLLALESVSKDPLSVGKLPPTPEVVNQYFDDSTGKGDFGEYDARGPWNQGDSWQVVESPAFKEMRNKSGGAVRLRRATGGWVCFSPKS